MGGVSDSGSLKFGGCEIAQSRMNALGHIGLFEPKFDLAQCIMKIVIVGIIQMLLLEGANEALGKGILCGLAELQRNNVCYTGALRNTPAWRIP